MPTGSAKESALLVNLDTESDQTLNLFVMKKKKLEEKEMRVPLAAEWLVDCCI
jgi:hypothetical protein